MNGKQIFKEYGIIKAKLEFYNINKDTIKFSQAIMPDIKPFPEQKMKKFLIKIFSYFFKKTGYKIISEPKKNLRLLKEAKPIYVYNKFFPLGGGLLRYL